MRFCFPPLAELPHVGDVPLFGRDPFGRVLWCLRVLLRLFLPAGLPWGFHGPVYALGLFDRFVPQGCDLDAGGPDETRAGQHGSDGQEYRTCARGNAADQTKPRRRAHDRPDGGGFLAFPGGSDLHGYPCGSKTGPWRLARCRPAPPARHPRGASGRQSDATALALFAGLTDSFNLLRRVVALPLLSFGQCKQLFERQV